MDWNNLIQIRISNGSLDVSIGPITLIIILVFVIVFVIRAWRNRAGVNKNWKPVEVDVSIANIGTIKLEPDNDIVRIAHSAWSELATRRAALPFDEDDSIIVEVYNSWYELFREFRELTKSIPAEEIHGNRSAQQLVELLVAVLNNGLRPHLTKWQARFRHWCSEEQKSHPELSPQEIQRSFPDYNELITDLKQVTQQLMSFAEALKKIAHG